jgi:hypothetical protein
MVSLCDTHWGNFNKFTKFIKMARVQMVKPVAEMLSHISNTNDKHAIVVFLILKEEQFNLFNYFIH